MNSDKLSADHKSSAGTRVTESLLNDSFSPEDNSNNLRRDNHSGLVSRLGKVSIAVFVSSFVVCFGCLAFLTFLWGADTDNAIWRKIVFAGWTTRSVTISALVLRWATATQAITCTSMLAAILLQVYAVPLPTAAAVSILRFDNTGPWSLLGRMRAEWHHGSFSIALLAILLTFTTLSLQLTSTALLSQVGIASLPLANSSQQTYYGNDPEGSTFLSQLGAVPSYLHTTPNGYPAFAEWVSNAALSDTNAQHGEFAPNSAPGITDTGTVMRAFLPIDDASERSRLIEYQGFSTVVDMRVVCMRPTLQDVNFSTGSGYLVTGEAYIGDQKPLGLLYQTDESGSNNFSASFSCGFGAAAGKYSSALYGWPLALCVPVQYKSKQGIYSVMEPQGQEELGPIYILINATSTAAVTDLEGSDVWETLSLEDSPIAVTLQMTLCMTAFEAQEMEIHATRSAPVPAEPTLSWNTSTATYNTEAVQRQLNAGTSSVSIKQRGIFDLTPRSWQWPQRPQYLDLTGGTFSTTSALEGIGAGRIYSGFVNNAQYSVLAQTAKSTSDPALALQAFFTTLFAISYYDHTAMFDIAAPSSQISLVQVIQPLGWTAYATVVSVVVLHLLLVLLTTVVFLRSGKLSRMGNAWAAVSQVLGPTTEEWIRGADLVDDKTVKGWLRSRGLNKTLVQIKDIQGRVQLVEKRKES